MMEPTSKQRLTKCDYACAAWCTLAAVLGGSAGVIGLWIAASKQDTTGLYLLILAPFLLAAAGVFAILRGMRRTGKEKWRL